jgi:hypothetical protein
VPEFSIPEITDEELKARVARIKPLIHSEGKLYALRTLPDLRGQSFLWDPKIRRRSERNIEPLRVISTLHTYGHYSLFKPSIAEVLAQIPFDLLNQVVAFSIEGPQDASDLNAHQDALNAGFQVAQTTFYRAKRAPSWEGRSRAELVKDREV